MSENKTLEPSDFKARLLAHISATIDKYSFDLFQLSQSIHSHPELSFQEFFASEQLVSFLRSHGFENVTHGKDLALPTAFLAEYTSHPEVKDAAVVGVCSEFDALPNGHSCGHNLIAILGVATALAVKSALAVFDLPGTIRLIGTPGEETKGGKLDLLKADAFKDLDMAVMAHPGNVNLAFPQYLALQSFDIEYFGKSSHAAAAPWDGINALDALVSAYTGISSLRQQLEPTTRAHGIIRHGGDAPNIIPQYTKASYYLRSPKLQTLQQLIPKVSTVFESAATMHGCSHKLIFEPTFFNVLQNAELANRWKSSMKTLGADFLYETRFEEEQIPRGSTDMGNVTWACPGIHPVFNILPSDSNTIDDSEETYEIHTDKFREQAKTKVAHEKTLRASKALAMVALDVLIDKNMRERVWVEWEKETGLKRGEKMNWII